VLGNMSFSVSVLQRTKNSSTAFNIKVFCRFRTGPTGSFVLLRWCHTSEVRRAAINLPADGWLGVSYARRPPEVYAEAVERAAKIKWDKIAEEKSGLLINISNFVVLLFSF
jgi:hypothetical protein